MFRKDKEGLDAFRQEIEAEKKAAAKQATGPKDLGPIKFTAKEWESIQKEEKEKARRGDQDDRINLANNERAIKTKKEYPIGSILNVLGMQAVVTDLFPMEIETEGEGFYHFYGSSLSTNLFPVVLFPSNGVALTLRGDILKSAKRIEVKEE